MIFKHEEPPLILEGILTDKTITLKLSSENNEYANDLTYEDFPENIKAAFDNLEDIFDVLKEKENIIIEASLGSIIMIVKKLNKNRLIEIPSPIQLNEVKKKKEGISR